MIARFVKWFAVSFVTWAVFAIVGIVFLAWALAAMTRQP